MSELREDLIKKARSFHVPGHGPDFEKMTNDQVKKHIEIIEGTFKMLFDEDDKEGAE
ncbi:hypothetical protein [Bacillus sp. MFK14]|uniref:hypothetical protein n=1 Tax=Bacillus sp. MFK14 TaxID=3394857 RepID=UPI003F4261A9